MIGSAPLRALGRILREPVETARGYDAAKLRRDALAGATVSIVAVPQSLAYALVAGVPPEVGVHTLVVQVVLGALLGSQPLLSSGPINTQSLLVAAIATRASHQLGALEGVEPSALYLQLVVALTLFKGVVQIALAAGGLGGLVRYVSASVIIGFTAGAGVLIAAGQVGAFLGIETPRSPDRWPGLVGAFQDLVPHLGEAQGLAVAIGAASLAIMLGIRALSPLLPGVLLAVAIPAAVATLAGFGPAELPQVGELPRGLPSPAWPRFELAWVEPLLGGALALALLGLMEAWSIGKTLAARTGGRVRAGHELFGQGVTNAVSSLFGCIPGSGSFSRSTLNWRARAATRFAGLFCGAFSLVLLVALGPLAAHIPLASLAAVLFLIAWQLVDWRSMARIARTSPPDASVCFATFAATLVLPLAYAVFLGILLNIALALRRASRLHLAEMVSAESGPFRERPLLESAGQRDVVFLQLQGDLFFGVADELEDRLAGLSSGGTRVVVIRLKRCFSIDATALGVLERFVDAMRARNAHVVLCGVDPELATIFRAWGLVERIGEDCFFEARPGVFASAHLALARARELVGAPLEVERLRDEDLGDEGLAEGEGPGAPVH